MNQIDVEQLERAMGDGDVQLVDVREPREYAEAHVPGAVLLSMRTLGDQLHTLDRSKPVHLICATGSRSKVMTEILTTRGFDAVNVAGGTEAWQRSGRPVERGL